jgi:hypothetical protein
MLERRRKRLRKRAKRVFRGYPVATVAFYGPDDTTATKLAVGIVPAQDVDVTDLRRRFSQGADIRSDPGVAEEVLAVIETAGATSIVMTDRIFGCPHEEGVDHEGPTCSVCPFLAGRDRWTGKRLHWRRCGVDYRTCADDEAEILLLEPSGTANTGDVADAEFIAPTGIVI